MRTGTVSTRALMLLQIEDMVAPVMERTEVEVIEDLEVVSSNLRQHMSYARHASSPHALHNYRRKYHKVQRLQQQVVSRMAQKHNPARGLSLNTNVLLDKVFTYPSTLEVRCDTTSSPTNGT